MLCCKLDYKLPFKILQFNKFNSQLKRKHTKIVMGKHQSKIDNPNANIINEVEMVQPTNDNMY